MSAVAALLVSTHSRPKAAGSNLPIFCPLDDVSTHSRPKAAGRKIISLCVIIAVSTHSRPKAAGFAIFKHDKVKNSFNSQPPEGGWAAPRQRQAF